MGWPRAIRPAALHERQRHQSLWQDFEGRDACFASRDSMDLVADHVHMTMICMNLGVDTC